NLRRARRPAARRRRPRRRRVPSACPHQKSRKRSSRRSPEPESALYRLGTRRRTEDRPMRATRAVLAALLVAAATLSGCATVITGTPSAITAAPANLPVTGDSGSTLDATIKNALTDIFTFWKVNYPKISGGAAFQPLNGGLFSV